MTPEERHARDMEKSGRQPWIGCDLDASLAIYTKWGDPIGEPILPMLLKIYKIRASGMTVKIFTARAEDPDQIPIIKAWLAKYNLQDLEITNVKDLAMISLYDDRCIQLIPNTGERADGKRL